MSFDSIKIGLVVGGGSGKVLSQIFYDFFHRVISHYTPEKQVHWFIAGKNHIYSIKGDEGIDFIANTIDEDVYGSYELIKNRGEEKARKAKGIITSEAIQTLSEDEAKRLHEHYIKLYQEKNVRTVFRTSINAEALYRLRENVGAYKGILISKQDIGWNATLSSNSSRNRKVILVRDQSQGYYTNDNYTIEGIGTPDEKINFTGHYSKAKMQRMIAFGKERAKIRFGKNEPYEFWASYKHHLFGNLIESWIKDIDPTIKIYQPDTGFNKLIDFLNDKVKEGGGKRKTAHNLVFLCSNEIGDLLYEPFTEILKNTGEKIDTYSRSFFTADPFNGQFEEYQTVHGSADDISGALGKGFTMLSSSTANFMPYATIRCASAIAAEKLKLPEFQLAVDKAVARTKMHFLLEGSPPHVQAVFDFLWEQIKLNYSVDNQKAIHYE